MTRPSKEQYIRVHYPNIDSINPRFEPREVEKIMDILIRGGFLKERTENNFESTSNFILRCQAKFKTTAAGRSRRRNKGV